MAYISENFTYDGINASDMGIILVHINDGLIEMPFGYNRAISEENIKGRLKPSLFGFEYIPLTFEITIAPVDGNWNNTDRRKIIKWLYQDYYKPLVFDNNDGLVYFCTPVDEAKKFDTGLEQGYATLKMRCNAPFPYSPIYDVYYDYTQSDTKIVEIDNLCNIFEYYLPEIEVKMTNDTGFSLINLSNGGEEFKFTGLQQGETIYINNERKQIISSLSDTYRLGNFNKNWFKLVYGINRIQIIGNVDVHFRMSYPIAI